MKNNNTSKPTRNQKVTRSNVKREQPRKDSRDKRVNFDNERMSKFDRTFDKSTDNDPKWYFNRADLSNNAANHINFIHPVGYAELIPNSATAGTSYAVPGVMALQWSPTISGRNRSIIKQAMDSQLSYVVHANSRNLTYDAQDLMIIELATALAYSFLANMIRAYGVMRKYNGINLYYPDTLIQAMGFNSGDLRNNYNHMLFDINLRIAKMDQFWVPATMPLFERWFWLNTNIYEDAESAKSQVYLFTPASYYVYSEKTSSRGAQLSENLIQSSMTWTQALNAMDAMIDALVNAQDRGIIMGDILKAYGPDKIYKINPIALEYTVEPVYNPEVLTQIENASITQMYAGTIVADVTTSDIYSQGYTISAANAASINPGPGKYKVLNFHQKTAPTPEQIMVASRLSCFDTYVVSQNEGGTITLAPTIAGTEMIYDGKIYFNRWIDGTRSAVLTSYLNNLTKSTRSLVDWMAWISFDWAPWIDVNSTLTSAEWTNIQAGDSVPYVHQFSLGDYDNYTVLQEVDLQDLHTAAILSLFDVPVSM